jgi:hypothetical protein
MSPELDEVEQMEWRAKMCFYQALHTAAGQGRPYCRKFPPPDPALTIRSDFAIEYTTLLPPKAWNPNGNKQTTTVPLSVLDRRKMTLHLSGTYSTPVDKAGIALAWMIHQALGPDARSRIGAGLMGFLFRAAGQLQITDTAPLTRE